MIGGARGVLPKVSFMCSPQACAVPEVPTPKKGLEARHLPAGVLLLRCGISFAVGNAIVGPSSLSYPILLVLRGLARMPVATSAAISQSLLVGVGRSRASIDNDARV